MYFIKLLIISIYLTCSNAFIFEYVNDIKNLLGFNRDNLSKDETSEFNNKVLYEVSVVDEKFISEAAKLTGVALSELDRCQQRIVLQLKKECNKMNDEDISKMAVMLLNCQSAIEGRRLYSCTREMAIKECTKNMDADTWNTYHLMTNRVRAVCYAARQSQFIGLTEHTINKLVDTTRNQVKTLDKIVNDQKDLQSLAENTLESMQQGHNVLATQQKDLERAQLYGQLLVENNLKRLADEKFLISETHQELTKMTRDLHMKIEGATQQLKEQSMESNTNHKEVLEDLLLIQETAQDIFKRIEESSKLLLKQSESAHEQYMGTLNQLLEVNKTIHSLANLIYGTRQMLEDRLMWISSALGGTDIAVDRLYLLTWHIAFTIVTMIASAFIDLRQSSRILAVTLPSFNLATGLSNINKSLNPLQLTISLISILIVHAIFCHVYKIYKYGEIPAILSLRNDKLPNKKTDNCAEAMEHTSTESTGNYDYERENFSHDLNESNQEPRLYFTSNENTFDEFYSPTPPLSRVGHYNSRSRSRTPSNISVSRNYCTAKTRVGSVCKLTSLPGREFCHRHMRGDSVMG